jgi:hypothetical protein
MLIYHYIDASFAHLRITSIFWERFLQTVMFTNHSQQQQCNKVQAFPPAQAVHCRQTSTWVPISQSPEACTNKRFHCLVLWSRSICWLICTMLLYLQLSFKHLLDQQIFGLCLHGFLSLHSSQEHIRWHNWGYSNTPLFQLSRRFNTSWWGFQHEQNGRRSSMTDLPPGQTWYVASLFLYWTSRYPASSFLCKIARQC